MANRRVYVWPGGLKSIAGGTRVEIKLSRPWQKDIVVDPANCVFCKEGNKEKSWRLKENDHTPFEFHSLIIPNNCWPKEDLRRLGGFVKIAEAIDFAREILERSLAPFFLTVHIGPLGGQNLTHLHYHLVYCDPSDRKTSEDLYREISEFYGQHPELIFLDNFDVRAAVGGGSKIGLLKAQIHFGLKHPKFAKSLRAFLQSDKTRR